ncbi:hypothetical protein ACN6K6_007458 [Streptomyces violaceoruber]|uniref:hypothetical protein n=1 Tax=Streptomyces violaceoruber TaxID=1935 RepID=UPI00403CC650
MNTAAHPLSVLALTDFTDESAAVAVQSLRRLGYEAQLSQLEGRGESARAGQWSVARTAYLEHGIFLPLSEGLLIEESEIMHAGVCKYVSRMKSNAARTANARYVASVEAKYGVSI